MKNAQKKLYGRHADNMMKTALKFGTQYNREKIDMEVIRAAAAHINNL